MFSIKSYFQTENDLANKSYQKNKTKLHEILTEIHHHRAEYLTDSHRLYMSRLGEFLILLCDIEQRNDHFWLHTTESDLREENARLYEDIDPEMYGESYANPSYSVSVFGDEKGILFSFFAYQIRNCIEFAFKHQIYKLNLYIQLFCDIWEIVKNSSDCEELLKRTLIRNKRLKSLNDHISETRMQFDPSFSYHVDFLKNNDLTDTRFLFRYGVHIGDIELKTAQLLATYPEQKIDDLAEYTINAFRYGFKHHGRTLEPGSTIRITYWVGQERVVKALTKILEKQGFKPHVFHVRSSSFNPQYDYDHKDDQSLYLDRKYTDQQMLYIEQAYDECREIIGKNSGVIAINPDKFGENNISPVLKTECLHFSESQHVLLQEMMNKRASLRMKYIDQNKLSSTCIAFPSPTIGPQFEEIFSAIWDVNMIDSEYYEKIQQKMIDVMDKGKYITLKGRNGNKTDLTIMLQELEEPQKQSNFLNGVADVNIPAGELFTTPQLRGTQGLLHLHEFFVNGLQFKDLLLTFTDGYISDYACRNFQTMEKNKRYIENNLLSPHKTLPMGEFAIGTNTSAYVVAKKYDIAHKLSILISEKMAPHIAIGDTCFAMQESMNVVNRLDKKIMVAVDNEKSACRKDNFNEAYTFRHIDIVIPYDQIASITVHNNNGFHVDIINNGRFVLPGTEELNQPLIEAGL